MQSQWKVLVGPLLALALGLALIAAACGGGGKSGTKTTTPAKTTPGQATTSATTAGGTGTPSGNTTARPSATAQGAQSAATSNVPPEDSAAIAAAVDQVLAALQQNDYERMRALSSASLRADVTNRQLDRVFRCFVGRVLAGTPQMRLSGNRVRVTVNFQSTVATPRTVAAENPWEFQREQGGWLLRSLPSCPPG